MLWRRQALLNRTLPLALMEKRFLAELLFFSFGMEVIFSE